MVLIKKNKFLFFLFIVLIVGLLFFIFVSSDVPVVKSVSPLNNQTNVPLDQEIVVIFDKDITSKAPEIVLDPQTETNIEAKQNVLIIKPKNGLMLKTQYFVSIRDERTKKELIKTTFKTASPQGNSEEVQKAEEVQKNDYPLSGFTPPDSAPFYFTYTGPKQLRVFLKGNEQTARVAFNVWVKSVGIDLSGQETTFLTPP